MRIFSLLALLASLSLAQTITIVKGPVDYQVYQRGADNKADIPLELSITNGDGRDVFLALKRGVVPVPGFLATNLGKVESGKLVTTIKGVPAGGPYRIELKLNRLGPAISARSNVLMSEWR